MFNVNKLGLKMSKNIQCLIRNLKRFGDRKLSTASSNTIIKSERVIIEAPPTKGTDSKGSGNFMSAWQVKSHGKIDKLELGPVKIPVIRRPQDVIVKVLATSVNPLDVAMLGGYGNVILNTLRQIDLTLDQAGTKPMILGRDFAGELLAKGNKVRSNLMVGDIVYGVVPPHLQGCHAQQVAVDESLVTRKPDSVTTKEAACILYTGMTAWCALQITGDLYLTSPKKKRVLVIGASGGVGTMAVQLLNAWKSEVVGVCSTDAVPLVSSLKADMVIDYKAEDAMTRIQNAGKYDIILDASGVASPSVYIPFLKDWNNAKFVTLRSPFLKNTDNHGLMVGMVRNVADFVVSNLSSGATSKGTTVRWGFFMPVPAGVKEIADLVAEEKLKPVIQHTYNFIDVPAAYEKMAEGHARGKIVVVMEQ